MSTVKVTYNGSQIASFDATPPVSVTYGGRSIASVTDGQTKTLSCSGKVMSSNVVVGSKTLNCNGKLMSGNVAINVTAPATAASVTVSGSGNSSYCYATIGGTKRSGSWSGTVAFGTAVTFGIWGGKNVTGTLTIDGTQVASKQNGSATYAWTIPTKGTVEIALSYNSNKNNGYGNITVTTE